MVCVKCGQTVADGRFCCQCGADQTVRQRPPRHRGNGQGTVFKRGQTWTAQMTQYRWTDDQGKSHRKYKTKGGFTTKKDAVKYLESLTQTIRKEPKLIDLWTSYESNELKKLSGTKQTAYKIARNRLDPIMGYQISDLTTDALQKCVNSKASSYYTARDMKNLLSHLYKKAMADQFVQSNLSQFIVLPDLEEQEAEPFTSEEVGKIWESFSDGFTFAGYFLLMIYSGMMPGELLSCRKDMIDLDKCEIRGIGKKTKIRRENSLIFADSVRPVVEELMEQSPSDRLVCRQRDAWYQDYHEATKKIGIRDLPPYSCRHTTGTEAAKLNLNASTIQKVMRHAKITTSQRYIHLGSEEAHAALNAMNTAKSPENTENMQSEKDGRSQNMQK